jgi:hypothetical protein
MADGGSQAQSTYRSAGTISETRIWLDASLVDDPQQYPFCLPFLRNEFEMVFDQAITVIVGENGAGKSTLLEGIAALAGYDEAGGGKGYRPVDHSGAVEAMGGRLSKALRASWLPKITNGWFFRAESFFSVARYLDEAAIDVGRPPPDFLSHSHGEGFFAVLRGALPKAGHFHLRRAGIGVVSDPSDRVSEAPVPNGCFENQPSHHGDALTHADGVSGCSVAAAVEIRA